MLLLQCSRFWLALRNWLLAFCLLLTVLPASAQTPEFRGWWVDAWGNGFFNSNQVAKLVADCHTYNFNALVVQMRRRGDAFYFPQAPNLEPRTTALPSNYDALAELIRQCHNATPRIEVHCWVTTFAIWGDAKNKPSQPGHVVNAHPEYLMQNSLGEQYLGEGYYLDPGHPGATLWNYNMAKDVVSNYDVDGFHWDYIRYPTTDSGYNPTAIARYNAEFGLSGQPSPSNAQFANWRRRQVTDFLRWTTADLLQIKTNLVISCSVFGSRTDAYNARFQDWSAWNSEGILDICMPMGYTATYSTFTQRCDDSASHQGIRRVYQGMGAYLNTKENTVAQLDYATITKGLQGTMFYSYRVPNSGTVNQPETFSHVRDNHQPTWVNTPTIPWKIAPTNGLLKGKLYRTDNLTGIYNATVTLSGSSSRTQKSEVHGTFGFFELRPGNYTVDVATIGLGSLTTNVTITAGSIIHLDLPIPVEDTTAPAITNVAVINLGHDRASVTWETDELTDSAIAYGETPVYNFNQSDDFLQQSHTLHLTNLTPNTTYNFQVTSTDASGNETSSTNFTFKTNPEGVVSDLIIDNPQATIVGSWSSGTSSGDKFGSDYRFKSKAGGAAQVKFIPNILAEGNYRVYEWHPQGTNRAMDAPHVITFNGGSQTIPINQQTNGGKWNELGVFNFQAGTNGHVAITDAFLSSGVVLADAIKFVHIPYPPTDPANLQAVALDSSQISLTWSDNATNEDRFVISRSLTGLPPFEDIATTAADVTTYLDTELTENTRYYYVVRGENIGGVSGFSNQTNALTRPGPPVIITQPLSQTVAQGQNTSFTVVVRAGTPTYQWQFEEVDIPGATNSTLNFTNVSGLSDGEYRVLVSNSYLQTNTTPPVPLISDTAVLRVNYSINVTLTAGGTYTLSPAQTGYAFNDNLIVTAVPSNGVFIGWSGDIISTNEVLNLVMNRNYQITAHFMPVSDLIVDDPQAQYFGSWTTSTSSQEKYGGSFFYTSSAPSTPTSEAIFAPNIIFPGLYNVYIWYSGGANRTANLPVFLSHQGGTLSQNLNQTTNGGGWRLLASRKTFAAGTGGYAHISNGTGETGKLVIADAFRFTLVNPPLLIIPPANLSVPVGEPARFDVMASGSDLAYQWRHEGTNIPGATASSYTINNVQAGHEGNYEVVLSNETGALPSPSATLSIIITPAHLDSATGLPDHRFQFTATGGPGNYFFQASTNLVNWIDLTNFATTNGVIQFIDPSATNYPRRFYRTRHEP